MPLSILFADHAPLFWMYVSAYDAKIEGGSPSAVISAGMYICRQIVGLCDNTKFGWYAFIW